MTQTNNIQTKGIITLLDELIPNRDEQFSLSYEQESKLVIDWCEANDFHYYGKPKSDFFEWEAIQEAENLGKKGVVLENLS